MAGLGYEYVRSLAAYFHHPSHSVGKSFTYLVGGRDKDNIQEAIKSLQTALGDEGVKDTNLQGVLIDITNDSSIQSAVEDVRQRFNGLDGVSGNLYDVTSSRMADLPCSIDQQRGNRKSAAFSSGGGSRNIPSDSRHEYRFGRQLYHSFRAATTIARSKGSGGQYLIGTRKYHSLD